MLLCCVVLHINISQQLACECGTLSVRDLAEQIGLNSADPTFLENQHAQMLLSSHKSTCFNDIFSDPTNHLWQMPNYSYLLTTIHSLIDTCCPTHNLLHLKTWDLPQLIPPTQWLCITKIPSLTKRKLLIYNAAWFSLHVSSPTLFNYFPFACCQNKKYTSLLSLTYIPVSGSHTIYYNYRLISLITCDVFQLLTKLTLFYVSTNSSLATISVT